MKPFATTRFLLALTIGVWLGAGSAFAQPGPELGDDFIVFVNGTNTLVPTFDGQVVDDPLAPGSGNKVMKYGYGNFSFQAFRFERTVGVDLSQNREQGDVLHLRLLVDPANAGMPNVEIMFEDKTDDSGADDGSADQAFRLIWRVPEAMRDGQWHELDIPLPPATWQELEDAKTAGTLDPLAENWFYNGTWSTGGFRVAGDDLGPNTADRPDLWREFEWTNVHAMGFFWDNNTGGGDVWVDDVYIGQPGLDLAVANDPAGAMSGVSFSGSAEGNLISWAHNTDFGGYNVYMSESPITDVSAEGVLLLETVPFNADAFEVNHQLEVPHPSLAPLEVYYAVTSLSQFGVENPDVSGSAGLIANPDLPVQPFILELTEAEGNQLFDDLSAGVVSGEGFPAGLEPFRVDQSHSKLGDSTVFPDSDDDFSGTLWMGYTAMNELFIYAEIKDDVIGLAGAEVPGSDAWQNDSIELGWGNYDVRDVEGGSVLLGSPHQDMVRGEFADYQFRISAHGDGSITHTFVGWSFNGDVQGGGTAYDVLTDGEGNPIGWKTLSLFPLDAIQDPAQGDVVLDPPTGTDLRLIPMNIALNDDDGSGREHQIQWSLKTNAGSQWWNTPAEWPVVALAGRGTATSSEGEADLPKSFSLEQNYPNPFNPSTRLTFTLATSERVTLSVYDVLGRKVATLIDGAQMAAGAHTVRFEARDLASGVYLYRLEAGSSFAQSRRMLLLK